MIILFSVFDYVMKIRDVIKSLYVLVPVKVQLLDVIVKLIFIL